MKDLYQKQTSKCVITLTVADGFLKGCYFVTVLWNDAVNAMTARMTRSYEEALSFFNCLVEKYN